MLSEPIVGNCVGAERVLFNGMLSWMNRKNESMARNKMDQKIYYYFFSFY